MNSKVVNWSPSQHSIADIKDWSDSGRLELRPHFQRRVVWSASACIMLMDTILRGIPMPKVFVANYIKNRSSYRVVIDGQQRITAILEFLRDGFPLSSPFVGDEEGLVFSELNNATQQLFLRYQIDFNEAHNPSDEEVREVYARVNKYNLALSKQELRRADFPGDFLNVSEQLALNDFFDKIRIFTPANRRRCMDVEYVSELLSAMLGGIQDKKKTLDEFYTTYSMWDDDNKHEIVSRFVAILGEIDHIFGDHLDIAESRFRQKADFYTMFTVIDEFLSAGLSTKGKDCSFLERDLEILHTYIRPESHIEICSEYAIKCVSQANSASSRRWRHGFLKHLVSGTYTGSLPDCIGAEVFYKICTGLLAPDPLTMGFGCPDTIAECVICHEIIEDDKWKIGWNKSETANQVSNSEFIHDTCISDVDDWLVLERPCNV